MRDKISSVTAIKYGESFLSESAVFQGGASNKYLPISFIIYLIKTDSHTILVAAGCDTMPGFEMKNYYRPVDVLAKHGVSAEEITDVVITHAHHDHIEAVHYFKNAIIYIQQEEYDQGKKYIPEDFAVNCFSDSFMVDDCVNIIKIGGHSIGSSIVTFEKDGKEHVIVGDECYKRVCLERKIPTGSSYCLQKSKDFIEKFSSPEYKILLCHEE